MLTSGTKGFGGSTLGTYNAKGLVAPFADSGDQTKASAELVAQHLLRELKVDMHTKQEKSLVNALTKPDTWLAERDAKIRDIINGELTPAYTAAINAYYAAGLPQDEIIARANRDIKGLYDIKMAQLEVDMPGANVLLTAAADRRIADGKLASHIVGEPDYKEKYLRAKHKYRARKNASDSK